MTDITELAQGKSLRKKLNRRLNDALGFQRTSGGKHTTISLSVDECKSVIAAMDERLALVEALEKAQAAERRWHRVASRIHEQACESDVKIDELEAIRAAAEKLVRCKGRYHSEQNYRALAALFGVNTPDLPPLEHENVHHADAEEMEIETLRQRIAELESRTVKLPKLKMLEDYLAEVAIEERKQILVGVKLEFHRACVAAGIKVEDE